MKTFTSEEYEDLGAEFQYQIIGLLNEELIKYGLAKETRKEICENFIFNFSMLLDQGEIKETNPVLTFKQKDQLILPNDEFSFHEYAFGNADEYFEQENE